MRPRQSNNNVLIYSACSAGSARYLCSDCSKIWGRSRVIIMCWSILHAVFWDRFGNIFVLTWHFDKQHHGVTWARLPSAKHTTHERSTVLLSHSQGDGVRIEYQRRQNAFLRRKKTPLLTNEDRPLLWGERKKHHVQHVAVPWINHCTQSGFLAEPSSRQTIEPYC